MDRLSSVIRASVILVALSGSALFGCGGEDAAITPEGAAAGPRSRVEAVAAEREDPAERFCDVSAPLGLGNALVLPQVEGPAMPSSGWRWVNVWATWCAPCVEEMPRIVAWRERLAADGAAIEPYFVSVDQTPDEVTGFRTAHPDAPASARLVDPAGLPGLITALGLDTGATIPIHALVDPSGRLRCVRTGSVAERDYDTIRAIIRGR